MSFRIRAALPKDIRPLYDLAKLTGGGFTNLPAERPTLEAKLERSEAGFSRKGESPADDLYMFMLENVETGQIRGTCQVFGQVGNDRPFYSYLISTLTQKSEELGRIFRNQALTLTTDLEGSSEVGGLFLHPQERAGGLGMIGLAGTRAALENGQVYELLLVASPDHLEGANGAAVAEELVAKARQTDARVTFINDRHPRATADGRLQTEADWTVVPTVVKRGASIGSGAAILCGVTIGEHAMIGAGAVVTRDVAPGETVAGVPARRLASARQGQAT